jgi:hypothetical protein
LRRFGAPGTACHERVLTFNFGVRL